MKDNVRFKYYNLYCHIMRTKSGSFSCLAFVPSRQTPEGLKFLIDYYLPDKYFTKIHSSAWKSVRFGYVIRAYHCFNIDCNLFTRNLNLESVILRFIENINDFFGYLPNNIFNSNDAQTFSETGGDFLYQFLL